MAVRHGYGKIAGADALVFAYDTGDTRNSYKGEPTVNYVPGTYGYSLYAYASGPVDTVVLNEKNQSTTVKRYTITNAINTARAAIYPSGLTTGVAYTFSFKWKYNGSTTASPSVGINASKGNPEGGANNNSFTSEIGNTVNIGNGWYLSTYTFIFSSVPTGKCALTFGINTGSTAGYIGETFDIYEAQFEIKNHRTQYSNGTRSSTQGLLDLTGNSTINLANVSFDSNAQVTFDGTDDDINVGPGTSTSFQRTIEMVFKTNTLGYLYPLAAYTRGGGQSVVDGKRMWLGFQNNKFQMHGWGTSDPASTTTIQTGQYYHAVYAYDQTTKLHYVWINGVLENNSTNNQGGFTGWNASGDHSWYVGGDPDCASWTASAGRSLNGELPVFKVYDRILSNTEVAQNYNHYKSRFNI
jgi:hypothetical protein